MSVTGDYEDLLVDDRDGVTWITINRPRRMNAPREITYEELADALVVAAGRPEIGAVVLTGSGDRAFSAGGDTEMATSSLTTLTAARHHSFRRMIGLSTLVLELDKPVIAAVNSLAIGGGVELVCFCDLVVAAGSAWFQLNGTAIGGCSWWGAPQLLPLQVGLRRAEEILYLGERVTAAEAARIGMINKMVPDGELVMLTSMTAAAEANAAAVAGADLQEAFRGARAGTPVDWRAKRANSA